MGTDSRCDKGGVNLQFGVITGQKTIKKLCLHAVPDIKGGLNYYFSYLWKALGLANYTIVLKANPNQPDSEVTLDMLLEDLVIYGSPKTVAEKVRAFQEKTGPFGHLTLAMPDWQYNRAAEENSMRLLATEVLPLLSKGTVTSAVA